MKYIMDFSLIYPMFAMVVLTFVVGAITLRSRIRAVANRDITFKYFRLMQGEAPDYMVKPARHFVNLFETPTLYYAACLAGVVTQTTNDFMLAMAWIFVILRVAHAAIHIGNNDVRPRMFVFLGSFVVIMVMWIAILVHIAE